MLFRMLSSPLTEGMSDTKIKLESLKRILYYDYYLYAELGLRDPSHQQSSVFFESNIDIIFANLNCIK